MHVFGLMTTASTLQELDKVVESATVVFSSICSDDNAEKHFKNIQLLLRKIGLSSGYDPCQDSKIIPEYCQVIFWFCKTVYNYNPALKLINLQHTLGKNDFGSRYDTIVANASLDVDGEPNQYFCRGLMYHINNITFHMQHCGLA